MAERNRPHIFVPGLADREPYRPPARRIEARPLPAPESRSRHAASLRTALERAESEGSARRTATLTEVEGSISGIYVTFESFPGLHLALESLDPQVGRVHPELRSVREVETDGEVVEEATVFIPDGKLGYFLRRIQGYLETADDDKPKNRNLLDRIRSIGLASLQQLWTDPPDDFPAADEVVWWEVWLRRRHGEVDRLKEFADHANLQVTSSILAFSNRVVVLVRASSLELSSSLDVLDDLAELRRPRAIAALLALEYAAEQADWVQDLAERTIPPPADGPAACILDTGIHQPHPLLSGALDPDDCHSCHPNWPVSDHHGHGTEMAGLALYGNIGDAILANSQIRLRHRLESVKILPPVGQNLPELYGAITATAASRVEIQAPTRQRVFSMSVTASVPEPPPDPRPIRVGQPSSWSAAIDALAAGLSIATTEEGMVLLDEEELGPRRLFLVSTGNVNEFGDDFIARCDLEPVEDPAQAWNVLTIGAFTDLTTIDPGEPGFDGWTPLAPQGELSPYSRTAVAFNRSWPPKPDVLFEGGNVARSPDGADFDWPNSYQLLTTKRPFPDPRLLTLTRQTSAATAQAAHLSTSILAEYPELWPETVRALVVHSARWTPQMRLQFSIDPGRKPRDAMRRRYGMGVPDLLRATRSASDALTLVAEDTIHPFDGQGRMREMHLHDLPWPVAALEELGATSVQLRVTLSYFVEPNPGSRGWVRRYSYPSHGLRFEVRRVNESTFDFRQRINQLARAEEDRRTVHASDSSEWYFGPNYRAAGSIHSDIWSGTAADLAQRGAIAVYPVTGWWKERPAHDHSDRGARYSLVVSIETPDVDVDIWTPVAELVGIPTETTIAT